MDYNKTAKNIFKPQQKNYRTPKFVCDKSYQQQFLHLKPFFTQITPIVVLDNFRLMVGKTRADLQAVPDGPHRSSDLLVVESPVVLDPLDLPMDSLPLLYVPVQR